MHIALADAETRLTELVRMAQKGEEVILTHGGAPAVKLIPLDSFVARPTKTVEEKMAAVRAIQESAGRKAKTGPSFDEIIEDMYDEDGLPK